MTTNKPIARQLHPIYQEGSNTTVIVDSLVNQFTEFQNQITELKKAIQISTATGEYLDDIGKLFNLVREEGESDDSFRARIKSFWPGFSGSGTYEDLKAIINRIVGLENTTIEEIAPLKILLKFTVGEDIDLTPTIKEVIWKAKPAGVYPFFLFIADYTDSINVSDNVSILSTLHGYWDYSEWGDVEW